MAYSEPAPFSDRDNMGRYDYREYVSLTMEFRCNLKCEHCMIEGTMDRLQPQSADVLGEVCERNAQTRQWRGLILTGSEITLHRDLPDWARRARRHGFEHVRIQTHGMRLASTDYCTELVEAGVDEFFVSVAGADAATHDGITGVPGSFEKTLRGLENLEAFPGVRSITNTVVTERSFRGMPGLVARLAGLARLAQMEFWFYWPMHESEDRKGLIASHLEVLPYLRRAIEGARALGRGVEVKNFPECLLGDLRDALDNDQPLLFIDPAFWDEFARNGFNRCVHRHRCAATRCLGLNSAYVSKFGDLADVLRPFSSEAGGSAIDADPAPARPQPRRVVPIVPV